MSGIGRRGFIAGAAAGGLAMSGAGRGLVSTALAQDAAWPQRPIKFIVPLAAGGGLDFVARIVGEFLSRDIGQQVYIENRTGAGGTIGIDAAIKSPPDGYSILVTNDNVSSAPHVLRLNVDYLKDLLPIIEIGRQPQALAVHPSFNVKSVAELVAAVKEKPGMGCATSGVGSNQHVLLEWFCKTAGVKLEHVPYRGAGQAINDVLAGHVKIAFLGPTALAPHHAAGNVRIIAQSGSKPSRSMPGIPTLEDAGYRGLVLESWYGVFAPLGTPPAAIAKLNASIGRALASDDTKARFFKGATEPTGGTAEEMGRSARGDSEKYKRLVSELNIKTG